MSDVDKHAAAPEANVAPAQADAAPKETPADVKPQEVAADEPKDDAKPVDSDAATASVPEAAAADAPSVPPTIPGSDSSAAAAGPVAAEAAKVGAEASTPVKPALDAEASTPVKPALDAEPSTPVKPALDAEPPGAGGDAETATEPLPSSTTAPAADTAVDAEVAAAASGAGEGEDEDHGVAAGGVSALTPFRHSPSGRRLSSPMSPTASPSLAAHDFMRRAEVERIPSQTAQPSEKAGGLRLWVTRAPEWPPAAAKVRAELRALSDAEELLELAEEAGKPEEELEALRAVVSKAQQVAGDREDIDWTSEKYAAYSLTEQLRAVKAVSEREAHPAVSAEGWLKRVKAKEKTHKSRYFVLTPKALVYFGQASHAKVSASGYLLADWDFPSLPSRISMRSHGARIWLADVTGIRTDVESKTITLSRTEEKGGDIVLESGAGEDCMAWADALEESRGGDDEEDDEAVDEDDDADAEVEADAEAVADAAAAEGAEGGGGEAEAGAEAEAKAPEEPAGGRQRRPTLLGRMFGRGTAAVPNEKEEAERKAKAEAAAEARKAKAKAAAEARAKRAAAVARTNAARAEARKAAAAELSHKRAVERKKASILAKQHREEEAERRAEMSLEAVLKLKAETEAKYRPIFWSAPKLSPDATEEEVGMTPTLHTVVEDRFRSYLEDRDGNPLALMRGWMTKDAESTVSMGVPKDRFFVLTPYFLAYFCSEADAAITAKGFMSGRAMGEKPRRLMRLGARIGLEHVIEATENRDEDETDDVLGDLDSGAVLAAERGDTEAAEALAREAKEKKRAMQLADSGGVMSPVATAGAEDDAAAAAAAAAGDAVAVPETTITVLKKGKSVRKSIAGGRNGAGMLASTGTSGAAAAASGTGAEDSAGKRRRGSSFAGARLKDGRCVTPPKPRTKPPAPSAPPPGLAQKLMLKRARERLGSDVNLLASMPRVESATVTIDLSDRIIRLQCHKVAYRDEWARMLRVWRTWWQKRQEQLTLEQWSQAAAFRHSQAAAGMSRSEATKKRGPAGGAGARRGGRRYVSGKGRGLPSK